MYIDPDGRKQCQSGKSRENGGDFPGGTWMGGSSWVNPGFLFFFSYQAEEVCLKCISNGKKFCFSFRCFSGGNLFKKGTISSGGIRLGAGGWYCFGANCLEDLLGWSGGYTMSGGKGLGVAGGMIRMGENVGCFIIYAGISGGINIQHGASMCRAKKFPSIF